MTGGGGEPLVSVIMPVRNEERRIAESLRAVLDQDYTAARMEVLVMDGGSTDGTRSVVEEFARRDGRVRLLDNPRGIVATAINRALRDVRGEIVVRVDGHCEIAPDYVRCCVAHLTRGEAEGVGGSVETIGVGRVARAIALAMSSRFGVGNSAFRTRRGETMLVDTVPFPAYRRDVMERAGEVDEELVRNQDDEYNFRIRRLGGRILLVGDVHSRYYSRGSLWSLARQYFQYGYWKVRVMQKHPLQMRARHFAPPAFVAFVLAAAAASFAWPPARWVLAAVAAAYVLANLAASLVTARAGERGLAVWLPACFAILHFGYGAGFLSGLIRFAGRWGDRGPVLPKVAGAASGRA